MRQELAPKRVTVVARSPTVAEAQRRRQLPPMVYMDVGQTQDIGPKVQSKMRSQVTLPLSPKSVQTRTAATFSARKEH